MFVSIMSFFSQISDPTVGGTYMTLLNTICNLGGNWPTTVALSLVDPLTTKICDGNESNDCSTSVLEKVRIRATYFQQLHLTKSIGWAC